MLVNKTYGCPNMLSEGGRRGGGIVMFYTRTFQILDFDTRMELNMFFTFIVEGELMEVWR